MRIYLVRHGKAVSKDTDPSRPLSSKGQEEVRKIAEFLKSLELKVNTILHSGKARALQTAEIISQAIETAEGVREYSGLKPNDPVNPVAKQLRKQNEDVMIVGHLPFLEKLAACLTLDSPKQVFLDMDTASVVALEEYQEGWFVKWMVTPSILP